MTSPRGVELGDFLRTHRARIDPARASLPGTPRRRVAGLRREEVAHLAGVSVDYYTRLEQGRQETASAAVLSALAATLQLSPEARTHLYDLAGVVDRERPAAAKPTPGPRSALPATVQPMFDALGTTPAFAIDRFADVVAVNRAARFLHSDFDAMPARDRNLVAWMLTEPQARTLYGPAWEEVTTQMIGSLRLSTGSQPGHPRVAELVTRLSAGSALFRDAWQRHEVGTCTEGTKRLHHRTGTLEFITEKITTTRDDGLTFALLIPRDPAAFGALLDRHTRPQLD
jgi:transcriptional regulator with XRE-family HTH domain